MVSLVRGLATRIGDVGGRLCALLSIWAIAVSAIARPSDTEIAFVKRGRLYVLRCAPSGLPWPGENPVLVCRLAQPPESLYGQPSWSPRGDLLFVANRYDIPSIWTVHPTAGARPRRLAEGYWPAMSPDGSILLLLRDWTGADNKGHIDLYSVELKSHQEKRVAKDVSGAGYFSPNGDTIAYTAQTGDSGQVIIMDAKRGVPIRRLTPAVNETCHGYSLNGRFLAITEGPLETRSAAIVDTFSSKERWLSAEIPASMAGLQAAVQPSGWSPDGHHLLLRVAFHEEMPAFAGGECLEISDLDNGRCRVLGLSIDKGAFSKDGSHIIALDRRRRIIVIDPRHPDRRQTLAAGVSGFAVR